LARQIREERTPPEFPPNKAIALLKKQMDQIDRLLQLHHDDPEVDKWDNFTSQVLIKAFGKPHDNLSAFDSARFGSGVGWGMSDYEYQEEFIKHLNNTKKILEGFIEQLEVFGEPKESYQPVTTTSLSSKRIFIVHGHARQAMSELALILTRLGLEPIILHEQPNAGMTIIEKLEKHSDVGYAFILLTPDDKGCLNNEAVPVPRARQNVVFEFGLFVGKLGREKVCCIHSGNVELPSDLNGLVYLPFISSVHEVQLDIIKELKAAGYQLQI
jgi:predicted nucleotide-binding protein